jgi:hypothetical protein
MILGSNIFQAEGKVRTPNQELAMSMGTPLILGFYYLVHNSSRCLGTELIAINF